MARAFSKDVSDILRTIQDQGWDYRLTANSHIHCSKPGHQPITISPRPGPNTIQHIKADFRRAGVRFPGDPIRVELPAAAAQSIVDYFEPTNAAYIGETLPCASPAIDTDAVTIDLPAEADREVPEGAALDSWPQDETIELMFRAIDEVKEMVEVLSAEFIDFRADHARVIAKLQEDIDTMATERFAAGNDLYQSVMDMQRALGAADDFVVRRVERLEAAVKVANPLEALRAKLATR